jgi:hypothetical protein
MLQEFKPLMRLAWPVILAEVGRMSMGLVDTIMVGPLGPAAIAATGIGSGVFTAVVIFWMGLMLGLDAVVSQAHGAADERECLILPILPLIHRPFRLLRVSGSGRRHQSIKHPIAAGRTGASIMAPPTLLSRGS